MTAPDHIFDDTAPASAGHKGKTSPYFFGPVHADLSAGWVSDELRRKVLARLAALAGSDQSSAKVIPGGIPGVIPGSKPGSSPGSSPASVVSWPIVVTRSERKVLRKRARIRVSEWAERHRTLTMSAMPGPWRNEVTPYLTGIMDAAAFPSVREIVVCKCPQSGVTEAVHNFIGCEAIDQDPGPVLYTFPDREMAEENSRDRIMPMIKSSRRLRSYLSGQRNDESMLRINLIHMPIYMAWASSPARLGNKPIKYGVADETDKFQTRGSKETGSIELMDKRFTTYRDAYKFWKISTPTLEEGIIWKAFQSAEVRFYQWVKCPECGRLQRMRFESIRFGECRDPHAMRKGKLAWYQCGHCPATWDDHQRNKALAGAIWSTAETDGDRHIELFAYLAAHRPRSIAFHLPAWETRFVSMSECAAVFLDSLDGGLEKLKDFKNQIEAKPFKQIVVAPTEAQYHAAVISLPAQTVPAEAVALTCGVDQQKYGFYFLVRAWARDYTSWMIHYGMLPAWEDLEALLFNTEYPSDGGRPMRIHRIAYDTGGGESEYADQSMTEAAYMWIRKNGVGRGGRVWGCKGATWPQANKIKMSKSFDKTPSGKPIPGGLQILTLDTEKLKDAFFYRLGQAADQAEMAAYLHAGTGSDYFAHITAEHKIQDKDGAFRWVKKRARNDWLDCECLAAAAADPEWPEGGIHLLAPRVRPAGGGEKSNDSKPAGAGKRSRW